MGSIRIAVKLSRCDDEGRADMLCLESGDNCRQGRGRKGGMGKMELEN